MRFKFALAAVGACVALAGVLATNVPASAQLWWWPYYGSYNYGYYPGNSYGYASPSYSYGYAAPGGDQGWCERHFRSYNPATGTYLGYDGAYHNCP